MVILEKKFYQQLLAESKYSAADKARFYEHIINAQLSNAEHHEYSGFRELASQLKELDEFKSILMGANQPSIFQQQSKYNLNDMAQYSMHSEYPFDKSLISAADFLSLSITKGSLTDQERQEIQSHVVHTQEFLQRIPWTDELSGIPTIAGAHHEKLDGSGYPHGLREHEIPVASKIMTIADIFDALTAQDRPYKRAVKVSNALDILSDEAKKGKVDSNILATFIQSKVYSRVID